MGYDETIWNQLVEQAAIRLTFTGIATLRYKTNRHTNAIIVLMCVTVCNVTIYLFLSIVYVYIYIIAVLIPLSIVCVYTQSCK